MNKTLERELREKYPALGKAADFENSMSSALKLHCRACIGGGSKDVAECPDQVCAWWVFRPYATKEQRVRTIRDYPTIQEYEALIAKRAPTQHAGPNALAEYRRKKREASEADDLDDDAADVTPAEPQDEPVSAPSIDDDFEC